MCTRQNLFETLYCTGLRFHEAFLQHPKLVVLTTLVLVVAIIASSRTVGAPAPAIPATGDQMETVLARHASALLDYYSTLAPTNGAAKKIHEEFLETAIQSVLMIRQLQRMKHLVKLKQSGIVEEPEETKINAACVVCCCRVASVVVTPCMHLALCMVCCDTMEIKGKDVVGRKTVLCPVCRMGVVDRMRVYRP